MSCLHTSLIHRRINRPPDGSSRSRHHSHNSPIRTEVLHTPYHTHYYRCEGEYSAVAEADEGGDEREEGGYKLHKTGGEEDLAEGEEQGGEEEKC